MKKMVSLLFATTIPLVTAAPLAAGQLSGPAGQRPIGQSAGSRVAELAQQNVVTIICRGGPGLSIENRGISPNGSAARDTVTLSLSFRRVDRAAGPDGRGLDPGTCSSTDRALAPMDPTRIQFDLVANAQIQQALHDGRIDTSPTAAERYADAKTIQPYLADASHYWRFDVVRSGGYFAAKSNQPVTAARIVGQDSGGNRPGPLGPGNADMTDRGNPIAAGAGGRPAQTAGGALPSNVLQMDDRAIIIIGGKQVAAGDVKRDILQQIARPSGPVQTFSVPARRGMSQVPSTTTTLSSAVSSPPVLQRADSNVVGTLDRLGDAATIDCSRGPIAGRLQGRVTPGERFTIAGACFGSQTGSIELIGQFPGGPLRLDFFAWKDTEIIAATPPVRGAPDHPVAFTIIRADGKRSTTKQVNFVAARERVELPAGLWSPSSQYKWSGVWTDGYNAITDNFSGSHSSNTGAAPPATFRLHVNPACWLDSMDATPRIGAVTDILGWQNSGPPNDANITVLWRARQTRTMSKYITGNETVSVYDIEFNLRAWASCPIGIAP